MTALHAPPGQRIRAKLIEGNGHPLVRFELAGEPPDLEALRLAARLARHEPWADGNGSSDVLCALAGVRHGDRFYVTRVRLGAWRHRVGVHRWRRGVLRCVGIVEEQSLQRAECALDVLRRFAPDMLMRRLVGPVVLQRPITRKHRGVAIELRLAPGSRVRLHTAAPANDVGALR